LTEHDSTQPFHRRKNDSTSPHRAVRRGKSPGRFLFQFAGWAAAGALALLLLSVVLVFVVYGAYQVYGWVVPGVSIGDITLTGLTWGEVERGLTQVYGADQTITVTDGQFAAQISAADLGLAWDTQAMAQEALDVGHGKDLFVEMREMADSWLNGADLEPILSFDPETARGTLQELAMASYAAPHDAHLEIIDGEVEITPSLDGSTLDIEASLESLQADPRLILEQGVMPIVFSPVPAVLQDVSAAKAEAERLLASDILLHTYDPLDDQHQIWSPSRKEIGSWLLVDETASGPEISVDQMRVLEFLQEVNGELGPEKSIHSESLSQEILAALGTSSNIMARVYHPQRTYVVQAGDTLLEIGWAHDIPHWYIEEENPFLAQTGLQVGQELTIPSPDVLMPLDVIPEKRIVISIPEQRLWTLENGNVLQEYVISTGIEDSPTMPGVFQVRSHELDAYASRWDLTMPHFLGIYEASPGFMNGIHGLPMLSSGRRLWAGTLGRPASYGCIILDLDAAETVYHWAEDGVVVEILGE